MQARVEPDVNLSEIPLSQKRKQAKPVEDYFDQVSSRNEVFIELIMVVVIV